MLRTLLLLGGVALFFYVLGELGPGRVLATVAEVGWGAIPIAVTYAVFQSFRALSLVASAPGDRKIRFADALWIRMTGEAVQFLTFTGPFLAAPAKALLLKRRGLTTGEGFAASLTEYLSYIFVGAALSIGTLAWLLAHDVLDNGVRVTAMVIVCVMSLFLVSSAVAIVLRFHLLGTILQWIAGLPGVRRRLRPNMEDVHHVEDLMLDVMHDRPARFGRLLLLEAASHAVHVLELYLIVRAIGLSARLWTAVLIEGAAKFVGLAFFFVPGQIGASEATHTIIFEVLGLPAVAGFTVPFIRRIRTVAVAACGLFGAWLLTRDRPT